MTDQPTPPLHEQVRALEQQCDRYRDHVPDGYFHFMDVDFAERRGFPASPNEGDDHTGRDGSGWHFTGEHWELHAYAPHPLKLIEQVRTLEADLVMCREQLAQETERAESYRLDVAALRDALDAPDDADVDQLIDVVHAITELAEKAEYAAQQLPTPDATNPAHLRWAAQVVDHYAGDVWDLKYETPNWPHVWAQMLSRADRLEAAQQQAEVDEVAVTKVVEELTLAGIGNDTPSDYYEIAVEGALIAAGLLQGGDEK